LIDPGGPDMDRPTVLPWPWTWMSVWTAGADWTPRSLLERSISCASFFVPVLANHMIIINFSSSSGRWWRAPPCASVPSTAPFGAVVVLRQPACARRSTNLRRRLAPRG
jgi:hypothetical protein